VLTSERVAVVRARLDLAEAELAARDARERLTVLLGLWGEDTGWVVSGNLGDAVTAGIDLTSVESRSIRASLELATNRAHLDASAQHAGLTSWQSLLPGAEAGALAEREAGGDWSIGPGITWELPLLDTGQAAALSARAKVQQRLHRHVQIAVEVRSAARMLRDRLALLGDRVEFVRTELLPTQARLVRETLQNYNAMQLGAFEVLMRKNQQIAAGHEYLTALRDAWLTRLDLEEILAGSLPESRRTPMWPYPKRTPNSRSSGGH
jgi:cobalt-zinc-cadmium efflux system outer membrane protein